jgi:acetyl-CoA carboxylase biotin carboxyl carrier protein
MSFDAEKIKQLMALIHDTDIATIEVCDGDQSIRLERFAHKAVPEVHQPVLSQIVAIESKSEKLLTPTGHTIHSPMVGITYLAPAPDSAPFVAIGQTVKKGQVLCIIEAMKMMNQIEADRAGVVLQLLVENGQPVEFGQPLFVIE